MHMSCCVYGYAGSHISMDKYNSIVGWLSDVVLEILRCKYWALFVQKNNTRDEKSGKNLANQYEL